ncbi:MAG: flagellar basal body-associated FliL family protein [Ilumatobacter sp.]|uniref:flagellar basal body-associated FliL family protein n=1 Tax=Ilumatobacter sp. TaxID=1967498 RepID=UPI0026398826|nr:flagellar basal body-associated FliL family protein [Ilumatobacter sp.]MDJ0767424.1 flagellar basal body-associated FliL family protein [Ilumatobacter sp.]
MADETTPTESEPVPAKSGGGAMRIVSAAMLSVALVTTGYFIGGRGGTAAAPPPETAHVEEPEEPTIGTIVDLEAVNVNLAGGHYLRVAVSLGLSEHVHLEDPKEFKSAPASDLVVSTFSGRTMEELSSHDGRSSRRDELEEGLATYYGDEIVSVFFTEFVMQ